MGWFVSVFVISNWDNVKFFSDLFTLLPDPNSHQLILDGDFNCVLHPALERSKSLCGVLSKSARYVNDFLQTCGMVDAWKYKKPTSRQYSFFASAHQTYSVINFIFIDKRMLPLRSCVYTGIVISDHSPVSVTLNFPDNILPRRIWRLNSRLLADKEFVACISKQIDFFLETNQTPDISKHTLWEAMKAFLQGQIISYSANVNKKRTERINQLISRINAIDQEHSSAPHANLYMERVALQTELDALTTGSEEELYLKSRQKEYEYGERASSYFVTS